MQTRRAALLTLAGAATSPLFIATDALAQHASHAMSETAPSAPLSYEPTFFKKQDYEVVSRLADLILPRTETAGAVDAHVPFRIDHEVSISAELQKSFESGLGLLQAAARDAGASDFVSLTEMQQGDVLTKMSQAEVESPERRFFQTVKELTVDWYYRSEEGLVQELGFHGNTFRSEFPGCTHPEHWPAQGTK